MTALAELRAAFVEGRLSRDEFWARMREQHAGLEAYSALLEQGELSAIEIRADGLRVVFCDGLSMRFRPSDTRSVPSVTLNHGSYEPEEARALVALASGARVVLDIGANAGFMALKMARALAVNGVVHAFEPVPQTHRELVENIAMNGLESGVVPHGVALGATPGEINFYVPEFHGSVAASARPLFAGDRNREVAVRMTTLDAFALENELDRIDLVKCDVEGAELLVLRGGRETIARTRPVLMLEMLRKWARVYDYHPNDIIAELAPLGYRCYALAGNELVEYPVIDDDTRPTNFFFLDPERHRDAFARLAPRAGEVGPSASLEALSTDEPRRLARGIREKTLRMVHRARASHVGSCLSIADILAVLYARVLRVDPARPDWPARDRFVLSKGHAAAALYAVLAERGFIPEAWLERYGEDGSVLAGHVIHRGVPGVELSTGSLGHGLSVAAGMALAAVRSDEPYRVFALLSDGECDEGSVWEAALFAAHQRLGNLTAIIDANALQSFGRVADVLALEPFLDKWQSFGWNALELDGHDLAALERALGRSRAAHDKPTVVIARTIKGKGVSFMEDQLVWHYRSPSDDELRRALAELEGER